MVLANVNWLGVLSAALSLASAAQLIITGLLSFGLAEFLTFTGCVYATGAGLVAGFVVLPNTIRIRSSQSSPEMEKTYGYTLCYQKLAMSISLALHIVAAVLAIIALTCSGNTAVKFYELMQMYHLKITPKGMVDNIQWALQCCGSNGYEDWYKLDWTGCDIENLRGRKKKAYYGDLDTDIIQFSHDVDTDAIQFRQDEVPFSCCARKILTPCVHVDLNQLGTHSINTRGCGNRLRHSVFLILLFELILYVLCICLEVAVLLLLHKSPETYNSKPPSTAVTKYSRHNYSQDESKQWEKFSNETKSAEIAPSSQSQVIILHQPDTTTADEGSGSSRSQTSLSSL